MDARIFGVGSIQTDHLKRFAHAVGTDGKACAWNRKSAQTVATPRALTELNARHQHRQAHHVAAVQRQLDDALVLDDATDVGGFRVQSHGRSRHLDGLGNRADLELEILPDLRRGLHPKPSDLLGLEPGHLGFHIVIADGHQWKRVIPG